MRQAAGVADRGHGTLGPCVVGERKERCCRQWCVAGLPFRGLEPPQEMGDGSRECIPRSRPVAPKVDPGRATRGWRSKRVQHVVRVPNWCKFSSRRKNGDGGHQWARQLVPVVEVVLARQRAGRGRRP